MPPTREIYWNIVGGALLYLFALVAVGLLAYGIFAGTFPMVSPRLVKRAEATGHH